MKIGIIYGTKRNEATEQIALWMKEALESEGYEVTAANAKEYSDFNCNAYIIGSAVYGFSTKMTKIHKLLNSQRKNIIQKPVAAFIVCGADHLPEKTKFEGGWLKKWAIYTFINPEKYMKSFISLIGAEPIDQKIFKGYHEPEDREKEGFDDQKKTVQDWTVRFISVFK